MKALLVAAALGLGATAALAGPSENGSRRTFEVYRGAPAPMPQEASSDRDRAPYALTGQQPRERAIVFKDIPTGRGGFQQTPFWVWTD